MTKKKIELFPIAHQPPKSLPIAKWRPEPELKFTPRRSPSMHMFLGGGK